MKVLPLLMYPLMMVLLGVFYTLSLTAPLAVFVTVSRLMGFNVPTDLVAFVMFTWTVVYFAISFFWVKINLEVYRASRKKEAARRRD